MTMRSDDNLASSPKITEMTVVPVAGYDDMLLNLSGAHAPFFTRNVIILRDNSGHIGVGEAAEPPVQCPLCAMSGLVHRSKRIAIRSRRRY